MADKSISELVAATAVGSTDLFVLEQTGTAKKLTGQILENWLVALADGHGGIQTIEKTGTSGLVDTYTITYADETTSTFTVKNGKAISGITQYWAVSASNSTVPSQWYTTRQTMTVTNKYLWSYMHYAYNDGTSYDTPYSVIGVYGDTGAQTYMWIKYSAVFPTSDADMADIPDKWIGIYVGLSSTAPTSYTAYTWYQYKGEKGDTGDASEVTSHSVTYLEGTSGTVVPKGSWTTTVPSVTPGNYLWTRTKLTFNDNTSITAYSVSRFGIDGAGSVSSVNNQSPDPNGNVALTASNIPTSDSESVQDKLDASATVEDLATYTRPNLLDNWYFVGGGSQLGTGIFPVNQRGQTSYSGDWNVKFDRWIVPIGVELTIPARGVKVTASSANYIYQNISGGLRAGTYTFSALFRDNTGVVSLSNTATDNGVVQSPTSSSESGLLSFTFTVSDDWSETNSYHRLVASASAVFIAAKLERGASQTLAHEESGSWTLNEIPNYLEQLAKCQRYLQLFDQNNAFCGMSRGGDKQLFSIPLAVPMAKASASIIGLNNVTIVTESALFKVTVTNAQVTAANTSVANVIFDNGDITTWSQNMVLSNSSFYISAE